MKKFFTQQFRIAASFVIVAVLFVVAYAANPDFFKAEKAISATTDNISGFTWSENIGWMSFNNTSDGGSTGYGASVSVANKATSGTGDFSGSVWSENIGWVTFDRSKAGNPPAAPFNTGAGAIAQVDWSTGKVTGWMRALSACDPSCTTNSGAGTNSGSWDGWIKLSDDTVAGWSGKGVKISANRFSGYAWGSDVVGWVDFAPVVGGVNVGPILNAPPCTAADVPAGSWGACQSVVACPASGAVAGIQVGLCPSGGSVTRSCTAQQTCTTTTGVCGDGICGANETILNCSKDCKMKYQQF